MQTAVRPVTCGICGAKYKIPASFSGTGVTCRRCEHRITLMPATRPEARPRRGTSGRRTITMRKPARKATVGQIISGVALLCGLVGAAILLL